MANRTESSLAHAWGRRAKFISETRNSLLAGNAQVSDEDEYLSALQAVDARLRTVTRQIVDRFQRRFGPWAFDAINVIYDASLAPNERQEKFGVIYDALHTPQDTRNAAALMEERIIPFYYGILQPDSSFPDGE